jgi:hypothetical protein
MAKRRRRTNRRMIRRVLTLTKPPLIPKPRPS